MALLSRTFFLAPSMVQITHITDYNSCLELVLLPALQSAVTILSFTTMCRSCSNRTAWTKRELDLGQSSMAVFEDCQATAGWIGGR